MATAISNPDIALDLLGPPPIINGEDPKEYFELWERFHAEAKPRDLTETALLRDVVDHIWEIRRLRRLKAGLLNAGACQGLELVLRPLCFESDEIAIKWRQRDAASVKQADEFLAQAGLGMAEVMAMTLGLNLSTVDAIDRIVERLESATTRRCARSSTIARHWQSPCGRSKGPRTPSSQMSRRQRRTGRRHDERAKATGEPRQRAGEHRAENGPR